jgi:hypothetical protein
VFKFLKADPYITLDLQRVRRNALVMGPAEHMDILVLDERPHLRAVFNDEKRRKISLKTHFVL